MDRDTKRGERGDGGVPQLVALGAGFGAAIGLVTGAASGRRRDEERR